MKGHAHHRYAQRFPFDDGLPLDELTADIRVNGLREEIVLLDDETLDGRRRERACLIAGVKPRYREFGSRPEDGDDPRAFVISHNIHRRHLSTGQRAMIAGLFAEDIEDESAERQAKGTLAPIGAKVGKSSALAGEMMNVSPRTVDRAKVVLEKGSHALQQAVIDDDISVADAADIAGEPVAVQNKAVDDVKNGRAKTAGEALRERDKQRDRAGKLWPRHLLPVVEANRQLNAFRLEIGSLAKDAEKLSAGPMANHIDFTIIMKKLEEIRKSCLAGALSHICPFCQAKQGVSCKPCLSSGWVTSSIWGQSPAGAEKKGGSI